MAAVGNHLQMIAEQALAGISKPALNVWYFEILTMTAPQPLANIATFLSVWYEDYFVLPILNMQSSACTHVQLTFNNLENFETDFAVIPLENTPTGAVIGDFAASSQAWSFKLVRSTRVTRNGSKRIPGVPDTYVTNNAPTTQAMTAATEVVDMLNDLPPVDLGPGGTMGLGLVIPKTPIAPATLPTVFNNVANVQFRGNGTQTSRKQLL